MPRFRMRVVLGLLLASATFPAHAGQDQSEPRPFQTEVNYVRVDLYPTLHDRPLTDLAASEIEVFEDDVPQKIDRLEHVSIGSRPQSTQPDPSSVRDMRRAAQDPRARVFVLFLDPRHVDLEGSMQVRRPLVDALNALIGGDDLIAVMTPEMPARSLTFSRRTGSVEQMLAQYWGEKDKLVVRDPVEARYDACYNESIVDGPAIAQEMIARRRETLVLDAVDELVQFLRGLREERKAVVTISDGWQLYGPNLNLLKALQYRNGGQVYVPVPGAGKNPITGTPTAKDPRAPDSLTISNDGAGTLDRASCEVDRNALAELRNEERFVRLMQAANRGNVSFYPVGPGGFSNTYVPLTARRRSLEMMADITDGHATLQPFNIEENLRRIVDDLSSYYLLGYYSNGKADGRYHRITVRVKRPGVLVRARAGYLAASPAEAARAPSTTIASPDVAEAQMVARALGPLAAFGRDRPLRLQAAVAWTQARTAIIRAVAEVPRGTARGDDWGKGGQLDVTLRTASGTAIATERMTLAPGTYAVEMSLSPAEALEPGEYTLQVRAKGVDVLSPAADAIQLAIQGPPLGGGMLFLRRGVTTGNREVLTADARFRRAERLILESPVSIGGDMSARLLDRTGKPMNIPLTATTRDAADGSKWRRVEVALAPLAIGDYIIESTEGSERTMTGFRVVP